MGKTKRSIKQDCLAISASRDFPEQIGQLPTGTYIIGEKETKTIPQQGAVYARVSSHDQKEDLQRQLQRLREYAKSNQLIRRKEVFEIASGLNGHRRKLTRLLADSSISFIIVEHRDRLTLFGFEYLQAALKATKRRIIVMNPVQCKDDLVQDMIDILTSFCARLYRQRSARNRKKKNAK